MPELRGMLTLEALTSRIKAGDIDTVIVAVCDMQGRLVGKRVRGELFIEQCVEHGIHLCTYLLATDMEMTTPSGYDRMNWGSGYGDYVARPDWSTLRIIPWLESTALVLCDAVEESVGLDVEIAPRTILRRQIERLAEHGLVPQMATELEFYVLKQTYEELYDTKFSDLKPFGWYNEDYQLLQATKAEPLYRRLRNEMTAAGIPVEFSKGEASPGQHEINITYADAMTSADRAVLFKHGTKEIAHLEQLAITFMSKPDQSWTGSSGHIHVSLTDAETGNSAFSVGGREMSDRMRWFLGGLIAGAREMSLFMAFTINAYKRFARASWAPVHLVWGRDNRTCAFRVVGSDSALRIENRLPGADSNPYLSFAAVLAAGIDGIERQIDPGDEFRGNGYEASDLARIPASLYEALDTWRVSELAKRAFGDDVHTHYLNMGTVEQEAFDAAVTTWERQRYLERG
ncbi:MAG: glutamine synthetase family protein [Thermomicrobiales bacterium]